MGLTVKKVCVQKTDNSGKPKGSQKTKEIGGGGFRSPYPMDANHLLYQLSYTPFDKSQQNLME
jgi:hypothetical protein